MQTVEIRYGPWVPSAPAYGGPHCVVANNVIPRPNGGYGPLAGKDATTDSVSNEVRGAQSFWTIDGTNRIIGGTDVSLFIRPSSGTVHEQTAGIAAVNDPETWDFAQFNDMVFATSHSNDLRYIADIDTDTTWALVPGNPPKARVCERVANFLMLGGLTDYPNRIQWGPYNDPLGDWTPAPLTQAGFADLPRDFGAVRQIVGGTIPIVFQERGIGRLDYIGAPVVWNYTEIDQGSGCLAKDSVVTAGFRTFFLGQDGFKVTNGNEVVDIGTPVNQWFFENAAQINLQKTVGAIDWPNQCVVWAWHSGSSSTRDRLLIYSWAENRWASGTLTAQWIFGSQLDYWTLEEIGAAYPDLDVDVPYSLDSDFWQGRARGLAMFDENGLLNNLQGDALQADFQTAEQEPVPGRRVFVSEAWPLIEDTAQASTMATVTRGNGGALATSSYSAIGVAGYAPLRADGRQIAIAQRIPAGTDWNNALGAQISFRVSGKR